ncbi:hypothetical protein yc1106_00717 [Curvularia clavata]|uniref:Uncharacterized protein n=1 Tax=Curvularia clavata TaxID=95742 RepID=A0A9Q8Z3T4_CURCL|nr:hypothetical protein yc1106_00717 [Curvularia clavata]
MSLLQLPSEIFQRVTHFLVSSPESKDVIQYRKVCRTFNRYLTAEICEQMSRMTLHDLYYPSARRRIFYNHGALILTKRIARGNCEDNDLLKFVQECVGFALSQGLATGGNPETRRLECTSVICTLLLTLDLESLMLYLNPFYTFYEARKTMDVSKMSDTLPAIAAALNNTEWLLKHATSISDILSSACKVLPYALDAAVICQSTKALCLILRGLLKSLEDIGTSEASGKTSRIALGVSNALRLAIRLHKIKAANVIFNFIVRYQELYLSTWKYLEDAALKDCMKQGNFALLRRALHHKFMCFVPSTTYLAKNWVLSPGEYEDLYQCGHTKLLQFLLSHKIVNPNIHNSGIQCRTDITPLMMALRSKRYDLAQVLVQNGADVNAKSKHGRGDTALIFAAERGFYEDVHFLLCNGANIAPTGKQEDDALWVATQNSWRKCEWILKKATRKGIDYIRSKHIGMSTNPKWIGGDSCSGALSKIAYTAKTQAIFGKHEDCKWPITLYELRPDTKFDFAHAYMDDWFEKNILSSRYEWHCHAATWL